jgi:hypothetical protein
MKWEHWSFTNTCKYSCVQSREKQFYTWLSSKGISMCNTTGVPARNTDYIRDSSSTDGDSACVLGSYESQRSLLGDLNVAPLKHVHLLSLSLDSSHEIACYYIKLQEEFHERIFLGLKDWRCLDHHWLGAHWLRSKPLCFDCPTGRTSPCPECSLWKLALDPHQKGERSGIQYMIYGGTIIWYFVHKNKIYIIELFN